MSAAPAEARDILVPAVRRLQGGTLGTVKSIHQSEINEAIEAEIILATT